jgi:F-type H+-transporting ATPase subunit gamma
LDEEFIDIVNEPTINMARRIVSRIMELYNSGEIDELHVAYTRFVNSLLYEPTDTKLLPIELSDFEQKDKPRVRKEIFYDPSPEEVFDSLVPQFMIGFIYGALVNSNASENCARMNAMENATHSADEMIKSLTLKYNSVRQLTITNELSEIVSAANAQKGEMSE